VKRDVLDTKVLAEQVDKCARSSDRAAARHPQPRAQITYLRSVFFKIQPQELSLKPDDNDLK
jgi:hypothetical protein